MTDEMVWLPICNICAADMWKGFIFMIHSEEMPESTKCFMCEKNTIRRWYVKV